MATEILTQEQKLWEELLENQSETAESALIKYYSYLVRFHVDRVFGNLPESVNKDDVISFGYDGLFDAIRKFDQSRELKFDTYASFRIRGAIMDGLRSIDWLPRKLREKAKKVERVSQKLEQQLFRTPTSEEIAQELDTSATEIEILIKDMMFSNVLSLDQQVEGKDSEIREGIGYNVPDDTSIQPEQLLYQSEIKKDLVDQIKKLNENEQLVISLYYHEELTMSEIGSILGVTTSRVSQIHSQAIFKLRKQLNALTNRS